MEESKSTLDRQAKTIYVAVPIGDQEEAMKTSMSDHESSQVRKMHLLTLLLLLGMSLFFVHKVMFYHHVSNVFHFAKHEPPCHHHVRFNPSSNDVHHHDMKAHSMGPPPGMHNPPHNEGFEHHHDKSHHHASPHYMEHPEMHHANDHYDAARHDSIHHPLPTAAVEPLSTWELFDQMDSSNDKDIPSIDNSESGDESSELDIWERIADFWEGNQEHDSSDSSDVSENESTKLDVWERIADSWVARKNHGKSGLDS